MLLHPNEFDFYFEDSESLSFEFDELDFEFPNEDNMGDFKMSFGDNHQIKKQIQCNIHNSIKYLKKKRRNSSSVSSATVSSSSLLCENNENDEDRVYLLKDIVSIIYSMIISE